jgi:hypothetical protein
MKKIAVLLAFLLAVGTGSVFGQMAITTDFDISGGGSVTFTYDIDDGGYGFTNAFTSDISLSVASGDSDNDAGMGAGWRGVAKLTGFAIKIDKGAGADVTAVTGLENAEFLLLDDAIAANSTEATLLETALVDNDILVTDPTVEAYITNDTLTVWVYDHPGNAPSKVAAVEDDADAAADRSAEGDDGLVDVGTNLGETGGVKVQYHTERGFDVTIGLTSDNDATGAPADQGWAISTSVDAVFDPVTVGVALAYGTTAGDVGVGSSVSTTIGPMSVTVGADIGVVGGTTPVTTFEVGGGVDVTLIDGVDIGVDFIYSDNVAVGFDTEISLGLGLVEALTVDVLAGLYDLVGGDPATTAAATADDEMDMRIAVDAAYVLDAIGGTVTIDLGFDTNQVNAGTAVNGANFGLTLAGQIPNTTMALTWSSNDLDTDNGNVAFKTTVSY